MKELYLIRHGKTEANEKHQYCGASDLPLSEAGAAELAAIRYDIPAYHILTSGMMRTEQTLQLLFGDLPMIRISGSGKSASEISNCAPTTS